MNRDSAIVLIQTPNDRIRIIAEFPKARPDVLFDFWTKPDLLSRWWTPVAALNPTKGGEYLFSWPKQNWNLRGKFTEFQRGKSLAFTWKWDHEPTDETKVRLNFEKSTHGGTKLTLDHEKYPNTPDGNKQRDEHVEGWMHFLGRLQEQTSNLSEPKTDCIAR